MTGLILHAGAASVTREQVDASATPERTKTWVPIPHGNLLAGIEKSLTGAGYRIAEEAHGLTHNGDRYFGLLRLERNGGGGAFSLVAGIRNAHDQKFPAGLVIGANVFVCDNLSFSSEVKLARKHTVHIERDLPQLIGRAIGRLGELRLSQERRFTAYQQHELSDSQAHDLAIRALDARVLPVTTLPSLLAEWRNPRHIEFRECGKTAWRMFNCFSEVLKGNLNELPRRTMALHGLMDSACNVLATGAEVPTGYAI